MIFNLFSIIILLPVLLGFGSLWQRFFGKIWLGISGILVSGFFLLLIVFQLFAFFIPLNLNVEIGVLIIGWGLFYAFGNHIRIWDFVKENKIGFSIFLSVSIIIGSFYPFLVDHFGYYVPTIKWISEYGLVKGITNFEWILGQMSPWHIFQSAFSHFTDPFLRLNVLLIFVFFLYILEKKSWVLLACSPFLFFFVQSPSPDLPSIIFSLMILNEILYHNKNSALLFGFSVLIFSIKPTMIWVPILAFLHGFWIQKKQFSFLVLGIFVFGIYVFKNIWVFGLPLFPLNILDLGLSWKPHPQFFLDSAQFAQMKTFDMQYSIEEIKTFSMWDYFNNFLNVEGIKGIINKAFILCLIALTFICIQKKNKLFGLILFSILVKSLFVLIFSAQYRFFIDVFFVLMLLIGYQRFSKKISFGLFSMLSFCFLIIFSIPQSMKKIIPTFRLGHYMMGYDTKQWYQPAHFQLNSFEPYQIGNLKFNLVKNYDLAFDTPIPALSKYDLQEFLKYNIFPQSIDNNIKNGFVWKTLTKDESATLQNIIQNVK